MTAAGVSTSAHARTRRTLTRLCPRDAWTNQRVRSSVPRPSSKSSSPPRAAPAPPPPPPSSSPIACTDARAGRRQCGASAARGARARAVCLPPARPPASQPATRPLARWRKRAPPRRAPPLGDRGFGLYVRVYIEIYSRVNIVRNEPHKGPFLRSERTRGDVYARLEGGAAGESGGGGRGGTPGAARVGGGWADRQAGEDGGGAGRG